MFSAAKLSSFHTFSYISEIEYTFPLFFNKNFNMLYSVAVNLISFPSTVTFFVSSFKIKSPLLYISSPELSVCLILPSFTYLLIFEFTLATNSRGLKGFVI